MTLPQQFGRYRIVRVLGRGGMGTVYLAQDTLLGRPVALKVPTFTDDDGPEALERFQREARSAAQLRHPNICPVYDVGTIDGIHYLSMAYIDGMPLSKVLRDGPRPDPAWSAAVIRKVALALHAAHQCGVIHRDVKPGNVLLTRDGEPVLTDFGLAFRLEDARLTRSGQLVGTPAYMAPEQAEGPRQPISPASDVYSLGAVLYEMLTGRPPFEGPHMVVLGKVLTQEPPPPSELAPDLDPRLDAVCRKALAKSAEKRYASMADFAAALTPLMASAPAAPAAPAPPAPVAGEQGSVLSALSSDGSSHDTPSVGPAVTPWPGEGPARRAASPWPWALALAGAAVVVGTLAVNQRSVVGWLLAGTGVLLVGVLVILQRRAGGRPEAVESVSTVTFPQPGTSPVADLPREVVNSVRLRLVLVPAGKFLMGSPPDEEGRAAHEGPRHEVELTRPFYFGAHPVTQWQYQEVMGVNPSRFRAGQGGGWEHPVENVSWLEAVEFCRRLSGRPEEQRQGRVYRLPTEAEWEYACRAGTTTPFHGGGALSSAEANFNGNHPYGGAPKGPNLQRTSPAGAYPANAFGLCDMHGNVWQWCNDWYDPGYYAAAPRSDPPGPDRGELRVLRGGAWILKASNCRAATRDKLAPGARSSWVGFRVVCEAAPTTA
jgi:formylglycine-generating enzyme required for sulfatase activity/predicted Ser/Thr protein kinase